MSSFGVALFSFNFTIHLNYFIYNYLFLLNQITEYFQRIALNFIISNSFIEKK